MRCPYCGGESDRYLRPKSVGEAIFRRHRCRECRHIFTSVQAPVDEPLAAMILERLEK